MSRPPAASTAPAWFATAAPVANTGDVVVGPTGVAVAEPPLEGGVPVVKVPLPDETGALPEAAETVWIRVGEVTAVPEGVVIGVVEEQGTVIVVPRVTIVVYEVTGTDVLALTEDATVEAVVIVVDGVQSGSVKSPDSL
jgi:hypothetical protein